MKSEGADLGEEVQMFTDKRIVEKLFLYYNDIKITLVIRKATHYAMVVSFS